MHFLWKTTRIFNAKIWELFLQKKSVFVRWMQDIVGRDKVETELNLVLGELLKKWEKSNHVNNPGLGTVPFI